MVWGFGSDIIGCWPEASFLKLSGLGGNGMDWGGFCAIWVGFS
jgi:hypothetical protein